MGLRRPIPPAGPGQLPTTGYVYGPSFLPTNAAGENWVNQGIVGLSTDDQGPIAGIQISGANEEAAQPVTIRYDWSPGSFYYLFAYHLGDGAWGGWVYDNAATTWTFIGSVQAPAGSGRLRRELGTAVFGAQGWPIPAFYRGSVSQVIGECSAFPLVDAYFYPTVAYRGTDFTLATLTLSRPFSGQCPTETTVEADWVHFHLGTFAG